MNLSAFQAMHIYICNYVHYIQVGPSLVASTPGPDKPLAHDLDMTHEVSVIQNAKLQNREGQGDPSTTGLVFCVVLILFPCMPV